MILAAHKKNTPSAFIIILLSLLICSCSKKIETSLNKQESFKFNLPVPIYNLDPQLSRGTASNYFLFNLHRGLVYYNSENKLVYWGARFCAWINPFKLECKLNKRKWSDGSLITAKDYINSFKTIFKSKNRQLEYLQNIKGFSKSLKNSSFHLDIQTPDSESLVFNFNKKDPSFIQKLSHQVFTPRKDDIHYPKKDNLKILFSGPYKLLKLTKSRIKMMNNKYYDTFLRPQVEALFIDEAQAALNLYESNKIDFLRFLPSQEITNPKYSKIIFKSFLSRLDGIVISKKLVKDINLRAALSYSLDFKALKKVFSSDSDPGCPPLPDTYFKDLKPPCLKFNLKKAKQHLNLVTKIPKNLSIYVPKIESNDHQKMAEWAQENWKNNLGISVGIEQLESKALLNMVSHNKVPLYRKGFNLEQPSCYFALENFLSDSASNFIGYKSREFDKSFKILNPETMSPQNCTGMFKMLMNEYLWIPTGRFYFSHLHSKNYKGYTINDLNQFDLSRLTLK